MITKTLLAECTPKALQIRVDKILEDGGQIVNIFVLVKGTYLVIYKEKTEELCQSQKN